MLFEQYPAFLVFVSHAKVSRKTGLKFLVFGLVSTEKSDNNFLICSFRLKNSNFSKWKLFCKLYLALPPATKISFKSF